MFVQHLSKEQSVVSTKSRQAAAPTLLLLSVRGWRVMVNFPSRFLILLFLWLLKHRPHCFVGTCLELMSDPGYPETYSIYSFPSHPVQTSGQKRLLVVCLPCKEYSIHCSVKFFSVLSSLCALGSFFGCKLG